MFPSGSHQGWVFPAFPVQPLQIERHQISVYSFWTSNVDSMGVKREQPNRSDRDAARKEGSVLRPSDGIYEEISQRKS